MNSREIARYALLTALALALSWLESLIPLPGAPPGVKLGLGNLVVIVALYRLGPGPAAGLSLVRVLLTSLTFGNAYALAYSLAGAAVSLAVMLGLKRMGRASCRCGWCPGGGGGRGWERPAGWSPGGSGSDGKFFILFNTLFKSLT